MSVCVGHQQADLRSNRNPNRDGCGGAVCGAHFPEIHHRLADGTEALGCGAGIYFPFDRHLGAASAAALRGAGILQYVN